VRFEIRHERNGTVDLALDGVTLLGVTSGDPEDVRDCVVVGMTRAGFDSLATGMNAARTLELTRSLDDARSEIQRLSDDRDHWRQEAENAQANAELWKSLAERQDNTAPLRMELRTVKRERDEWRARYEGAQANAVYVREQYGHPDEVEELKATIVRQAREITQLKGESE
jgi:outer membrane murein-binding lipoprotein Lpp